MQADEKLKLILFDLAKKLHEEEFTGSITINFYKGGISSKVEQRSSLNLHMDGKD